jgi:hypothetical protein
MNKETFQIENVTVDLPLDYQLFIENLGKKHHLASLEVGLHKGWGDPSNWGMTVESFSSQDDTLEVTIISENEIDTESIKKEIIKHFTRAARRSS